MGWLRTSVIAGTALAISGAGAVAADVTTLPPASYMPRLAPANSTHDVFLADWYLRAGLGERWGFTTSAAAPTGHLTFKSLGVHEVRVGLRWNLNDLSIDL